MREKILEAVSERDIDILLLEEFHSSPDFQKWFLSQIKQQAQGYHFVNAWHSVTHPVYFESDLEVVFSHEKEKIGVMIENKIGADFQPAQSERYHRRGKDYLFRKEWNTYVTVLIAPQKYLNAKEKSGFDYVVSYEQLLHYFQQQQNDPLRTRFKAALIKEAIIQAETGYIPIPDNRVGSFWENYYQLATSLAPELEMKKPGIKPTNSGFIYFKPKLLPKGMEIVHKLPHGNMDLALEGKANEIHQIGQRISLPPNMVLTKTGKSAAIRIKVPIIDTTMPFEAQIEAVKQGINAAKLLLKIGMKMNNNQSRGLA